MSAMTASWPILHSEQFQLLYWVDQLRAMPTLALVLALAAGILILLYGRSLFRTIVILNAVILAGWLGWRLGEPIHHPLLFAAGLAVVFGLLAWPLFKFGVAVFFGLIGAFLLTQLAQFFACGEHYWPIFAAAGFLAFAVLGWFLLMASVTVFTALEGSLLSVLSLFVLAERGKMPMDQIPWLSFDRPGLIHLAVLVLAVLGILHQLGWAEEKGREEKEADTPKSGG